MSTQDCCASLLVLGGASLRGAGVLVVTLRSLRLQGSGRLPEPQALRSLSLPCPRAPREAAFMGELVLQPQVPRSS
ncbi:unnamed protein product [Rangifer tarandus platyrhynchus]|uniref:Uncharacterized protein n=1 Tax=Rangifer tarandus platyrhynchus TaxID=3082113 RepID=A0AC59YFY0_RANTA